MKHKLIAIWDILRSDIYFCVTKYGRLSYTDAFPGRQPKDGLTAKERADMLIGNVYALVYLVNHHLRIYLRAYTDPQFTDEEQ